MSYLDTHADPAARTRAIIAVGAVHALIGAGLVAGLTVTGLVNVDDPPFVVIDPTAPDQPQRRILPALRSVRPGEAQCAVIIIDQHFGL